MRSEEAAALSIEAKLDLLLTQGGTPDRALALVVDVLAERGSALAPEKREECAELALAVARRCSPREVALAAQRLAGFQFVSRKLVLAMAQIAAARETSAPAESAPAEEEIPDEMTRRVASAHPLDLRDIAAGEKLSEQATARLIARGDDQATAACLRNRKARLSLASFAGVALEARNDETLRKALCERADIPEDILPNFWPACADAEKARLLVAGFSSDSDAPTAPPPEPGAAEEVDPGFETERQLAELVLHHTKPASLPRAAKMLAERAGVDEGLAFDLICGSYERGLVLLARAAELDEWGFLKIVCSRLKQISSQTTPHRALRNFRDCSRDEARAVLSSVTDVKSLVAQERAAARRRPKLSGK
ncbi:MAG: DUF2336 domain-containing protein [Microvirga sp.]|nr:DUF2336 domain-containing protein [Microvirga sp.]